MSSSSHSSAPGGFSPAMGEAIEEMRARLDRYSQDEELVKKHLETFDQLDFMVFSKQDWVRLHESHAEDVIVNWPDGHQTNGLERHIFDLTALFVYAPDTQIRIHPVRFGVARGALSSQLTKDGRIEQQVIEGGEGFTCVTGVMIGTFTKPMPVQGGQPIQPTGKAFAVPMCTVGRWLNGVMQEEWLYWDNATYMKQIGLG